MNIIVIGCGRVGAELAYRLYKASHNVTVIDNKHEAFYNLPADFRGRTVEGDALNQNVLQWAGIDTADGLAAVTNSDSANAVVSHIASAIYHLPNVVVRNYDSRWRPLHETFGHQVISSSSWGAQRIEELLYDHEVQTVFSAGNGEVELYEFTIRGSVAGMSVEELIPSDQCVVAAMTRAGHAVIPNPETILEDGDILLVSATLDGSAALRKRFPEQVSIKSSAPINQTEAAGY